MFKLPHVSLTFNAPNVMNKSLAFGFFCTAPPSADSGIGTKKGGPGRSPPEPLILSQNELSLSFVYIRSSILKCCDLLEKIFSRLKSRMFFVSLHVPEGIFVS